MRLEQLLCDRLPPLQTSGLLRHSCDALIALFRIVTRDAKPFPNPEKLRAASTINRKGTSNPVAKDSSVPRDRNVATKYNVPLSQAFCELSVKKCPGGTHCFLLADVKKPIQGNEASICCRTWSAAGQISMLTTRGASFNVSERASLVLFAHGLALSGVNIPICIARCKELDTILNDISLSTLSVLASHFRYQMDTADDSARDAQQVLASQ